MKKSVRIFSLLAVVILALFSLVGITACKNWMTGNLFEEIENEVKVASAEEIEVYVRFADNNFGTVSAKCAAAQLQQNHILVAKQDVEMEVSAIPNNTYGFKKWAAFSSSKLDPKKNISSMVFDDEYMDKFGVNELPESVVVFENAEADTTTCKILQPLSDPSDPDAMIVIVPVVARRATLSARNTYPKTGSDGVVRNQRIVLSFDKPMNFATFVSCKNPSGTFDKDYNGNNIYYRKDSNGNIEEYFYDWNRERIQISVYDTNEKQVDEDIAYGYFQLPVPDESNPRKIIISPNLANRLPKFAEVNIVISYDVEDSHGYTLTEAIEYYYMVGQSDDTGAPTFTELSGGRPLKGNPKNNSWSDYVGYLDEADAADSLTNVLPPDSTNIADWEDSVKNKPFTHRITNAIDLHVIIKDKINSELISTTASDADIDHFAVRARHLLYADGTPGTGTVFENIIEKNYEGLKYHSGAKNFEPGEPGDSYDDPEDGYSFPYYLPASIPDGLIKLEIYAQDVTGNSGESEPFALYVVKDTSAPDIESQTSKILSASTNTLNEWFNSRTINQLAFKVNAATPFTDTISTENGIVSVHPKFMTSTGGSSLFWAFGNAPENMAERLPIDNTGAASYDMSKLVSTISEQGAMTFYAQLSDDMDNSSEIKNIPLKIYYDTILPESATIQTPQEADKIYPLTGVAAGASGTFFTREPTLSLVVSATDSGAANVTDVSSGIAGFLVPTASYNEETLYEALSAANGNLNGLNRATDGASRITLAAGSEANNSKQNHFIYSVDYALNAAATPTTVTIIQDTTGPGITLTDNASYTYNAEKSLFKANAGLYEKAVESGISGTVKGVSQGAYYYSNAETSFPFHVTLNNEFGDFDSGAYQFVVRNSNGTETARGSLSDDINLPAGTYTIVAFDNLGNETTTAPFTVYQDSSAPEITAGAFHIYGRKFGLSTYNTDTTNYRTVNLQFEAKDIDGTNSGIRKLTFTGASFDGASGAPLVVTAGDRTLAAGTDYIVQTEAPAEGQIPESANSYIIFTEPRLESTFRVDNIVLPAEDGTKIVSLMATDATGNSSGVVTAGIFSDSTAPSITSVCDIALAPSIDGTGDVTSATNLSQINVQVIAKDATSGIKRFYIGDTYSEVGIDQNDAPGGSSLISAESKVLANGAELPSAVGAGFIELLSPSISSEDVTYTITNVMVPDTARQGTKTVYVVLYDNTELRNLSAVSDTIIYDTTGPAIVVEDNASKIYNASRPFYRTTDTEASVAAQTGSTGRVNGLYEGTYYYNASEPGFNFTVSLTDENTTDGSSVSGAHIFYVDGNETAPYTTGTTITLAAGVHTISAKDKLGNVTTSKTITVAQDPSLPVFGENFQIHGRRFGENTYNETTSNYQTVNISFTVSDDSGNNTGLRSLTFTGAAFNDTGKSPEGTIVPVVVKADGIELSRNTDYIILADQAKVVFTVPRTKSSFEIENITFPQEDGTRTITIVATDAARNSTAPVSSSIFLDTQAPEITSVTAVSTSASVDGTNDVTSATKETTINVQIVAKDPTSGIKKIYIGDAASNMNPDQHNVPGGNSLLTAGSKVMVNGAELPSTVGAGFIELNSQSISSEAVTYIITNVNLPHPETQGTQDIYVVLFDDTKLRNQNSVSDSIIYDTTGPAIVVTDYASSTYDGTTLNKYRSNDVANNTVATTGGNGNVTGLVTGTYYYNKDESSGFKFTVNLTDQNVTNNAVNATGTVSGAYRFYIGEVEYESGADVYLLAGTYTIVAKDKLGNTTTSNSFTVKQDEETPEVSNVVIHGTVFNPSGVGDSPSTTSTKDNNVYVTFSAKDISAEKNDTGLLKVTLSGDANFDSAKLYEGDTEVTAFKNAGTNSVDFWFASPITTEKTFTVKDVILTDSDGNKTITVKASDRTAKESSGVSSFIFKDVTAPTVSDVEIISTDEDALHENSHTTVTNDEKVTVLFKAYDVTSGIRKLTICDANGNSLLTTGDDGSVVSITHNGEVVVFNGTVSATEISLLVSRTHKSDSASDPFIFEVTNVSMPKVSGNFVQGRNYFYVKAYDDVLNVAAEGTAESIIFDNVPPAPKVNMYAPSHFNPYEAYRGVHGNEPQYFVNNVFWKKSNDYYFELSGNDNNGLSSDAVAGFWQGTYKEGSGTEKDVSGLQKVTSTSSETTYNFYVYDAVENKSIPSAETNTIVTVKKDASAPILTFDGYYANGTKLVKDEGFSSLSNTNSATHYYYTNSDTVDLKFKAHDTGVGILYFDISGSMNASFKNGRFTETDSNAKIAEFLSKSTDLQLWIDGVQYYRGGYDRTTGKYSDGPEGYGDRAYWNEETQKWYMDSAKTQETQNVYFNCYKDLEAGQDDGIRGFRDFALYNSIPASSTDSVFELRNIDLSCLEQSYMQFNIYVYDHMGNNSGIEYKKLIYDTNKPKIVKTSFVSSGDVNYTSSDALSTHDLVVEFNENYSNTSSYSGVKVIELELTSNVPDSIDSTLKMDGFTSTDPEDSFKVYLTDSAPTALDSTKYEITSSYKVVVSSVDAVNHIAKLRITLKPTSTGLTSGSGYHGYSYASGTASRYLVIHGLTIAGGEVDQIETIKVTLKDRAGNVSDNTGNENNVVEIGYDKSAPIMYPVSGNTIVNGKLARSYFKTVFGKPTVLSLHHAASKIHTNTSIDDNMVFNIFPEPGDTIQNYGDGIDCPAPYSGTAWEDNADLTELVLRFNKNGSGIKTITLAAEGESVDSWDFRRILFNPSKVQVSIDEGKNWYSPGSSALPYTVTEDTLTFTNSGICPKGENCSVMIKGVMPNFKATYCRHNGDGNYRENIWWSDVVVTSFAGMPNTYSYALALADDVDTPEFTRTKISVTDTSSIDGSFTDGKTIQITGRIQSKSTHKVYSSGLWAIQLSGAEFDLSAIPSFKAYVSKPTGDFGRKLLLPNSVSYDNGDQITYSYDSTNDYSVRRTVSKKTSDSKVDANPSQFKFSISSDRTTLYLNMPLDIDDTQDFTLSGIKLPENALDGAQNISLKLIKYSGLTNDPDDRYWDYDESNERDESYKIMFREVEAYYSATEEHRGAVNFAQNRTNSITLDTVAPVITWNGILDDATSHFHSYKDASGVVFYPNSSVSKVSFGMSDTDGSGIYGYYFDDSSTGSSIVSKYITGSISNYSLNGFNSSTNGLAVIRYLHVMDKVGNITNHPVTYEANSSSTATPTTWKLDSNSPSIKNGVVRHFYGDTPGSRFVLKHYSDNTYHVYHNAETSDISGKFTDVPVADEIDGVDQFFSEAGSGLYGTMKSSNDTYSDIWTDYRWSTGDTYHYISDKVGNIKSFTLTKKVDSGKPELSFYSIYSNKGGNSFWPKSNISLSTDESNPTVLYLGGDEDEDYIRLVLNAKDSGTNATGIYKVTVNGTELPVGSYENTVSHLSGRTEFPTDSTPAPTVTWLIGKGEAKSEGEANGLLRSITITDWVGNETTYWFKLVSDVTPPVLAVGSTSPFTAHSYLSITNNRYFTQFANDKQVIYFSESNLRPGLDASGVSDASSGYDTKKWYKDNTCTTQISNVTLTHSNAGTSVSPTSIFTRDNVGNVLEVKLTELPSDVEDITTVEGNVLYCYASADTTAKLNVQEGQYVDGNTEIALASDTPVKVFTKATEATVKITPTTYYGIKYSYADSEASGTELGTGNFKSARKSVEIPVSAGKTYNITIGSTKFAAVSTTYQVQVVQDTAKPEPDNLVFTITKNSTAAPNGANDPGLKSYFDAENWTLYYNTASKIYPYFTITGITDDLSGPAKIGLNSSEEKPGMNFTAVVNGEATDVWGSFTGDQEKALYISDNVGNGDENGAYFKIIHGISDTEAPDSVTYTGDDAVFFVKNDGTIVTNGAGTLTGSDAKSGIDTVVEQGTNIVATDKVGNSKSFPIDKQPSLGKASGIEYTSDANRDAADTDWSESISWAHRYVFTVSGYTAISKIYILGIDSEGFQGNKVTINGTEISKNTPTVTAYGEKIMVEIELYSATGLSNSEEVKIYSGYGNCASPENLQIFVTGTLTAPVNANRISLSRNSKSTKRSARKARSVVIPENRDVAKSAHSSEKAAGKQTASSVMSQVESQSQSPATKVSDATVKKGRQDLRKRAAEFEKSEGIVSSIPEVQAVEQALTEIVEEITESGEITTSENISKEVEIFEKNIANNNDDVYNDSNIAKSVVISIIFILIISCSIIMFCVIRKRSARNRKE